MCDSPRPGLDAPARVAIVTGAGSGIGRAIADHLVVNGELETTIDEMMAATGWQAHSVRGFLAGSLKKRHSLEAISVKRDGEPRRYRLR